MKNKILKTFLFFVLFSALIITSSYATTIKENVTSEEYKNGAYVIGSTRFDGQQLITASMIFEAGVNEADLNNALMINKKIDSTLYYYISPNVGWYKIGEKDDPLSEAEAKKLEENLNIFFVNNEEKVLEIPFNGVVDPGSIETPWGTGESEVTFKDGRFYVPATTFEFIFTSGGSECLVYTKSDESTENFELIFGEFEIRIDPKVTISAPKTFEVGQSTEFTVSTTANSFKGEDVLYALNFSYNPIPNVVEKLEYYDAEEETWKELIVNENNISHAYTEVLKLKDEETKFRVTFLEFGEYNIGLDIIDAETSAWLSDATTAISVEKYEGTISYLGGLSQEPTMYEGDNNTVYVNEGTVNWYPADKNVGRNDAGNRIGFQITAPTEYSKDVYANAKIVRKMYYSGQEEPVEIPMTWNEVKDGDTYFQTWPLITSDLYMIEIDIEWKEGNTQTFRIYVADIGLQQPYSGTISYIGGLSQEPEIYKEECYDNYGEMYEVSVVNIQGRMVNWYPADKSVGRNDVGNRFGLKITAPTEYSKDVYANAKIVRKMYYNGQEEPVEIPMTWDKVKDGDTYYTSWPVITPDLYMIEIDVEWEKGNTQTFKIYTSGVEFQQPYSGTISYLGGLSQEPSIDGNIVGVYGGVVNWYPADTSVGRNEAGNRFGLKITAPAEYTKNEYANAKIVRKMYYNTSDTPVEIPMTWDEVKDGDAYYTSWPLITSDLYMIEIDVEWEKGNTQTFTIHVSPEALQVPQYKGTISYLGGLSVAPVIDGNVVNVNEGTINWYPADESIGRNDAGNRFGFKITAPVEYTNNEYAMANITRKMYYLTDPENPIIIPMTWEQVHDSDTHFETWPLVTDDLIKVEIDIEWEMGNVYGAENRQTFTINVADKVTLAPPAYAVAQVGNVYFEDLVSAIANVGENNKVVLLKDIKLTEGIEITNIVTLDLNGKTITASEDQPSIALFKADTTGKLTIVGEGTVNSASQGNDYSMAVWARNGGEVVIESGTFTNLGGKAFEGDGTSVNKANNNELIYASGGGKITINGGKFIGNSENPTNKTKFTLNKLDNDGSVIKVTGGTYTQYDPANSASENPNMNFVAEGYKVVVDGNKYQVLPYNAESVTEEAELRTLIANGGTVKLGGNIELTEGIEITNTVTLNLNGKTITASEDQPSIALFKADTTGKLTIVGEGTVNSASQGNDYSMAVWARNGGEVVIESGTFTNLGGKAFEGDGTSVNKANNNELIYASGGGKITINGGEFIGNTENPTYGTKFTLNKLDNDGSVIKVTGGTFTEYNPEESASENPIANFIVEGYMLSKDGNKYTVIPEVANNN